MVVSIESQCLAVLYDSPGALLQSASLVHYAQQFGDVCGHVVRVVEQLDWSTSDYRLRYVEDQDLGGESAS